MTQTLYILKYNNYYNRILKKMDNLVDYEEYIHYILGDTVFIPNDSVDTFHIFGDSKNPFDGAGDYLLVTDELDNIISRWFIIDTVRTRNGQWKVTLHRDVLADYYNEAVNAPCFIEKATLDLNDPMIFNKEDMSYNQIKTREWDLKDITQTSWIVGYLDRKATNDNKVVSYVSNAKYDYSYDSLDAFQDEVKFRESDTNAIQYYNLKYYITTKYGSLGINKINIELNSEYQIKGYEQFTTSTNYSTTFTANLKPTESDLAEIQTLLDNVVNKPVFFNNADLTIINSYKDKIIQVENEDNTAYKYYQIKVKMVAGGRFEEIPDNKDSEKIYNALNASEYMTSTASYSDRKGFGALFTYAKYYLDFIDVTDTFSSVTVTIPGTKSHLSDAPYDMFCYPVNDCVLGEVDYKGLGTGLAQEIYKTLGESVCYDIQLLPYCPMGNLEKISDLGILNTDLGLVEGKDYVYIKKDSVNISIMFFPNKSSFSNIIPINIQNPNNNIDFKVANECDMYRLCSPNYNGVFEFSITKNGGLQFMEVNATYKPFNPYIHLNPNFGNLYGGDFNDNRGLICGGDYSIATVSDAWVTYQLQNKNYENIFNRQIANMDVTNKISRDKEVVGAITGSLSGVSSGAGTGFMASGGNVVGAIVGGAVGGISSGVGGAADIYYNDQLRDEAKSYAYDMYGYNLGTIQALPTTLSKSSAFDINNKIFPFLEYYTATDIEKQALKNKIKYNGMTVMRIGFIKNFISKEETYIKGKLIRVDHLKDDYHIINSLGSEVNKGFFIKEDLN